MNPNFGYEYPAGAEEDPYAPWNEEVCDKCGHTADSLNEEGVCQQCTDYGYAWEEGQRSLLRRNLA